MSELYLMKDRFRGFLPVVVDCETGGFKAATDGLLEIAAVMLKLDPDGGLHREETWRYHVQPFPGARLDPASLAVNGMQKPYGDRMITEDDYRYGDVQYAVHKMFNEFQAQDYNEKYGMTITAIRPANVTGPDKVRGSVDHVNIITQPAQGKSISFPYKDAMRCPIHVDDIAEVFTRVLLTDKPKHAVYSSGGIAISLGEIADMVREFLPDAWWYAAAPGLAIFLVVIGFNMLGDGLRDVLDPRTRRAGRPRD